MGCKSTMVDHCTCPFDGFYEGLFSFLDFRVKMAGQKVYPPEFVASEEAQADKRDEGTHKGLLAPSNVYLCQDMRRNSAATPGMDKCLVSRLGGDSCPKRPIIYNASMQCMMLLCITICVYICYVCLVYIIDIS